MLFDCSFVSISFINILGFLCGICFNKKLIQKPSKICLYQSIVFIFSLSTINTAMLSIDLREKNIYYIYTTFKANRFNCIALHLKATDEEIAMRFIILIYCCYCCCFCCCHCIQFGFRFTSFQRSTSSI